MNRSGWVRTVKGAIFHGYEFTLEVIQRKTFFCAIAEVQPEGEFKQISKTRACWHTLGDAQRACFAMRRKLLYPPPYVRDLYPGEEETIRTALLPPSGPLVWDVWSTDVEIDPGGTPVFGPGPYVKVPFWHQDDGPDDRGDGRRDRIRCPYGYPGDTLFVPPSTLVEVVSVELLPSESSPRPMSPLDWVVKFRGVRDTEPDDTPYSDEPTVVLLAAKQALR